MKMTTLKRAGAVIAAGVVSGLLAGTALASDTYYEVTVYNLTKGMTFTPVLVATTRGEAFFSTGYEASPELETIAETGASGPLLDTLDYHDAAHLGFIEPGASDSVTVAARGNYKRVSIASMLIPTNDTFFAFNGIEGPKGRPVTVTAIAYDAGTEENDELCINLPGPGCGGDPGPVSENGEGTIYVSGGIRGVGDIDADLRDFNNPVAKITITRLSGEK